jgi:hypothetical protein
MEPIKEPIGSCLLPSLNSKKKEQQQESLFALFTEVTHKLVHGVGGPHRVLVGKLVLHRFLL